MPVGVVKTDRDEELWSKAKEIAKDRFKKPGKGKRSPKYWSYVMGIYKKMKGGSLGEMAVIDGSTTFAEWYDEYPVSSSRPILY
jgi:hypothetical protein